MQHGGNARKTLEGRLAGKRHADSLPAPQSPIILALAAMLMLIATVPGRAQAVDVLNPPAEMIQLAWRLEDGRVHVQYNFAAPNACWQQGEVSHAGSEENRARIIATPRIAGSFCALVITAVDVSGDLDLGPEIEIIVFDVEHPEGGNLEHSELWILDGPPAPVE
jgi:hypothetical protein